MAISRRQFLTLAASAPLAGLFAGCAPATPAPQPARLPRTGGTLKVAIISEPPTLDSVHTTALVANWTMAHVFESLFTYNSRFEAVPHLVEQYEVDRTGTRFTFHLRKGILFHSGQELTAADAAASLRRWGEVSAGGREVFGRARLDRITELDRYTLSVSFHQPAGLFVEFLAQNTRAIIIPAAVVERVGKDRLPDELCIGTGPFRLVERAPDRHIRLQRWEKYLPRAEAPDGLAGRRTAYFDEILFIPVPEDTVRADGVVTGEYHFAEGLQLDHYNRLKGSAGLEALLVMPFGYIAAFFNKKQGLFTDQRLRQAVLAAVDLEHAMLTAFGLKEFIGLGPELAPKGSLWYSDAGGEVYNRPDPEKARRLLREAGYQGQPIRWLTTKAYPFHYNLSLSFREQLERVGFKVDLQLLDWAALVQRRSNPELWDVFVTHGLVFEHPAIRSPLSAAWPGWWESERKDQVLAAIWAEPDREKHKQLVRQLQQLIWEEVPWIQAGHFAELRAIRKEVVGYQNFAQWFFWNCGFAG
jgi:peptide/nickel transport system substrate-binding protein